MKSWIIAAALSTSAVFATEIFEMNADSLIMNIDQYEVVSCERDATAHNMQIEYKNSETDQRAFSITVVSTDKAQENDETQLVEKIDGTVPMELHQIDTEETRTLKLVFVNNKSRYTITFNMVKPFEEALESHYRSVIDELASTIEVLTSEVEEEEEEEIADDITDEPTEEITEEVSEEA